MKCTRCGFVARENEAVFCPSCGMRFDSPAAGRPSGQKDADAERLASSIKKSLDDMIAEEDAKRGVPGGNNYGRQGDFSVPGNRYPQTEAALRNNQPQRGNNAFDRQSAPVRVSPQKEAFRVDTTVRGRDFSVPEGSASVTGSAQGREEKYIPVRENTYTQADNLGEGGQPVVEDRACVTEEKGNKGKAFAAIGLSSLFAGVFMVFIALVLLFFSFFR